ncbi:MULTISPECIES: hypothetical protein [Bradyrhizobium]|uniref:Nucleotidyl transferase AbiEii/AbiGii toxin family protein n=1 Tax=Bradyrhizobium guangdongense TaxID=1325090 RepID=A0AA87WAT3_9BRAD|nr:MULTISPECIES: hypothetical protein [Bradyrhizobium]MDT4737935.1 hypothetical protein [Bradyrhizobium sp. WYCCWR 12699]GGI31261.1 hypothetical protein GCM10010987_63540 [Bradyrhizobium guangdongense]
MTIQGHLKEMLKTVAGALGDELRARLVFVGGCTTALYITDPVTLEGVRSTDDVDLIVDLVGFPEWAKLVDQLRTQGFSETPEDNVICRMKLNELKVDFMPDDEKILGFSNRWYAKGIETAVETPLDDAITIRRLTPPLFIATKLEAYRGRGSGTLSAAATPRTFSCSSTGGRNCLTKLPPPMQTLAHTLPSNSERCSQIATSIISSKEIFAARWGVLTLFATDSLH